MASKIEGWISEWWRRYADKEGKYEFNHVNPPVTNCTHCTLVIHDGPPEKVYTESEHQEKMPRFGPQGVGFGNFWISYDKMVGWDGDPGPERDLFWKTNGFAKSFLKWLNEHHLESITPKPL